jgi:peptidoglycan/LPS O-acetylase OafA/YrhL
MLLFTPYEQLTTRPSHAVLFFLWITSGGQAHRAVLVFFVLSGFLVGGSVLRSLERGTWSWKEYATNRLSRLYIVLIPALASCLVLDKFSALRPHGLQAIQDAGWNYGSHSLHTVFINLFFLQNLYLPSLGTNLALWSLSNEFWYYVAFPFLAVAFLAPIGKLWRWVSFAAFVLICLFISGLCFLGLVWLMGVAVLFLPRRLPLPIAVHRIATGAVALLLLGYTVLEGHLAPILSELLAGTLAAAFLYLLICLPPPGRSFQFLRGVARHISAISYTLYLVHLPALVFAVALLNRARTPTTVASLLRASLLLLAVLLFSEMMYFCFERNTVPLRRWLGARATMQITKA